jgi:hypothetical protein
MPDPNFPGMRVCKDDLDQYDPWRLPARQTENIALRHPRPDVSLARTNSQLLTQGNLNNYTPGNSIFIEGIPPYAGAQGDLSTNGGGFNTSGNFPVPVPPNAPVVLGFSPSSGSEDGGTVVTITGTGFSGTTVQFGSTYAEFTVINDTTIEAIAPTGIYNQSVRITVTTNAGRGVSGQMYTYTAGVPKVYSISPNTGDIAGGESVLIGGYRFTGATSVTIGGTEVPSYTIVDDSRISATTPAHAVGVVNVTVTTPTGTGTGLNLFTYGTVPVGLPTIISVSPSTGDVAGGENVTLTGTNFVNVTSVTIGGTEVDSFTVVDEEHITTVTPAHAAGSVDVTVTAEGGTGTGTNLFTYSQAPVGAAEYIIVGGGGAGGYYGGGGGGGEAKSGTVDLNSTTTYSIIVGAGGIAYNAFQRPGNGESSSAFGITALGGGSGGSASVQYPDALLGASGANGGGSSSGGVNMPGPFPGGTGTVGYNGGSGRYTGTDPQSSGTVAAGGGGGMGAVGGDGTGSGGNPNPGNGGNGVTLSIGGFSGTFGGGGSGTGFPYGTVGTGGTGGGGSNSAGTPNTGGGGSGGTNGDPNLGTGYNGGSGVVIISYPTGSFNFTGGTVTTNAGYTIHTFTSSGELAPAQTAIYLTPGTTSWTVPADWTSDNMIELWGGGGGGGNGGSVSSLAGSGGGGGGYARIVNTTSLTPGQVVTVAVGAGGAYGPNGITAAQPGGTTIFGSVSATGGSGGTTQYASAGGSVSGGMGIGGDVNYEGGRGGGQTYSANTAPGGDGEGDEIGGAAGGGMGFSDPNYPNVSGGDGAGGFGGAGGARGVSESQPNGFPGQDNPKGGGGGGSLYYGTGTAGAGGYPGGGGGGTFGGVSADGANGVIKITYTRNPNAEYAPYTTNGTYVVPEGVTQVKVLAVGHGAAGSSSTQYTSAYGGGEGGQVVEQTQNVTPGEVLTITLGGAYDPQYGSAPTTVVGNSWTVTALSSTSTGTSAGSGGAEGGDGNKGANPAPGQFGAAGGNGGVGVLSTITGEYYGGGGGGAGAANESTSYPPGQGGLGGGGTGATYGAAATSGAPNSGGGGGGGNYFLPTSGQGGTGFVAIQAIQQGTLKGTEPNRGVPSGTYANTGSYIVGLPNNSVAVIGDTVVNNSTGESGIVKNLSYDTAYLLSSGYYSTGGNTAFVNNLDAIPTSGSDTYNIYSSSYEVPRIVGEHCLAMFDFSNPACYSGSGSVIYDLTQNQVNGSLVGNPTYVSNQGLSYIQLDNSGNQRVVFPTIPSPGFSTSWTMYAVVDYSRAVNLFEIFQSTNWGLFNVLPGGSSTTYVTAYPTNPDGSPNLGPYSGGGSQGDAGTSGRVLVGMSFDKNTNNFTTVVNSVNGTYIVAPTTMAKQADFIAALGKIYFFVGYQPDITGSPSYSEVKAALQTRFGL